MHEVPLYREGYLAWGTSPARKRSPPEDNYMALSIRLL